MNEDSDATAVLVRLIDEVRHYARSCGCTWLRCLIPRSQDDLRIRLSELCGFHEVGEIDRWIRSPSRESQEEGSRSQMDGVTLHVGPLNQNDLRPVGELLAHISQDSSDLQGLPAPDVNSLLKSWQQLRATLVVAKTSHSLTGLAVITGEERAETVESTQASRGNISGGSVLNYIGRPSRSTTLRNRESCFCRKPSTISAVGCLRPWQHIQTCQRSLIDKTCPQ